MSSILNSLRMRAPWPAAAAAPIALAWTMHERMDFRGHACKFGDVEA
jgi:hypothetical protein